MRVCTIPQLQDKSEVPSILLDVVLGREKGEVLKAHNEGKFL